MSCATDRPPEELAAGAITLVRYQGWEASILLGAVIESLDQLRPWMPWAAEDPSEENQVEYIRRVIKMWDAGENFSYWMREEATGDLVGCAGLYSRAGPAAVEIGYWLRTSQTGRGFATAASKALTTAALGLSGLTRVEIHCDEANTASASIPRRLGYRLDRVEDDEIEAPGETGRSMVWVVEEAAWASGATPPPGATKDSRASRASAPPTRASWHQERLA